MYLLVQMPGFEICQEDKLGQSIHT
jgi:hypothetical protein